MNDLLISVVMPVYKVEKYLSAAVESVLGQTYKNLELILVDDCSPDRCGEICDEYAKRDSRVKVIHKPENQGLGKARETGIGVVSGERIMFIDSDDWIEKNTLEVINFKMSDDTDISVFGFSMQYENAEGETEYTALRVPDEATADTAEKIGNIIVKLDDSGVFPYMWNKLYKTAFLKESGVEFNSIQSMEDFFYNAELFPLAKKVVVLNKAFYNYRKPKHETLATAYNPEFFELCKKRFFEEKACIEKLKADTEENLQCLYGIYVKHLIACCSRICSNNTRLNKNERKTKVREYLNDTVTVNIMNEFKPYSFKMKIAAAGFKTKSVFTAFVLGRAFNFINIKFSKIYSVIRK